MSVITIFLALWGFTTINAEAADPNEIVVVYFTALKEGDTGAIKNLLTDDYYLKKRVLLENNLNYSEFLRKYYNGMEFRILSSVQNSAQAHVDVEQNLQDGTENLFTLTLNKDESEEWKIAEEIIKP